MAAAGFPDANKSLTYFPARRDETVVETHFGETVADPYRWLEDPDSAETKAFVEAQNKLSRPLYRTAIREKFFKKLEQVYDYPKYGVPFREGDMWYNWYNTGLQNQNVLYARKSLHDEQARVVLDPNVWTEDGTAAVGATAFTDDGSLMAYTRSDKGSDWMRIFVVRVEDGYVFPDVVKHVKFSSLEWSPDNQGFFYNRYDVPDEDQEDSGTANAQHEFQKVFYHKLGTDQQEDILILSHPEHPKWLTDVTLSWDRRFLIVEISESCSPKNQVWIADLDSIRTPNARDAYDFSKLEWKKIVTNFDAGYEYLTNDGTEFVFLTNKDAPRYKLVKLDILHPEETFWKTLVHETSDLLSSADVVDGNKLILHYFRDVTSQLEVRDLHTGQLLGAIPLPLGSVKQISGERRFPHMLFSFTSFTTPSDIYQMDFAAAVKSGDWTPTLYRQTKVEGADLSQLEVSQAFFDSKDDTKIPMFIMHKKGLKRDGNNPTALYGYGGFNISITPSFTPSWVVAMLNLGMVMAVANIRGGGEYGKAWYEAAIKTKKQVSYDDFQQAAEYLISQQYTSPRRLAIHGGSNGGLLVGACINQRPDLYGAAVLHVGVLDLLRFHKFTIGHAWTSDYGSPENEEEFRSIFQISPLHNIGKARGKGQGHQYPAVFLLTGDHDDRVSPFHSLKFIAELQHSVGSSSKQTNPLVIRVDTNTGHGAGKPVKKSIEEAADVYGFLANVLGIQWHEQ
ncbi:Prolyl oligopeptidase (Precursor),related [Neospora caninum Liverpool]|uniref:Prolyl endopeptidase n=1 Tax=Neospora caninum (strain Liverpool) TaxID=572307 RepID=F0VDC4_NEOCL|nr:Prolyl oligopeptidase (Precursor),related [Neospora caninum Liverpool]CBZ51639.1 Prolyl oligopeptidase (Precursor),related [Neospora caninum Liverpool]CEL65593.1 TPA: Prolyl oligopeptidase (Precursor),related [Neospora caninum Liverpool]|eukprot:XP_003881672.1 Prolyl oligopeptidase (Precursor),related [Neospora caninum Liverpool]